MPEEPNKKKFRDRYNEARENMRDNKAMQWLKANRVPIGIGIGGVTFGYLLRSKTVHMAPTFNNTVAPTIAPVMNNTVANHVGHPIKMVERIDDGKLWKKAKDTAMEIAEERGVSYETARGLLSKNINGHIPDVYGVAYRTVGLGTTG